MAPTLDCRAVGTPDEVRVNPYEVLYTEYGRLHTALRAILSAATEGGPQPPLERIREIAREALGEEQEDTDG